MSQWEAPCIICGYNGSGFYQPEMHPCAKHRTERDARRRMKGEPLTEAEYAELDRLDTMIDEEIERHERLVTDLVKKHTTLREFLPKKPLPRR